MEKHHQYSNDDDSDHFGRTNKKETLTEFLRSTQFDSSSKNEPNFTQIQEDTRLLDKNLRRKLDWRIVPITTSIYFLCYLDRVNVGNAKLANLEDDLNLTKDQFNIALSIYYVGALLVEIPFNILLIKAGPTIWLSTLMFSWGVVTTMMSLVTNINGLLTARFFLGIAEGGLFPGIVYFLTLWYKRCEHNLRIGLFFSGASLAGAAGGLLAYAIMQLDGLAGFHSWQLIFLFEGLLTILMACAGFFVIPSSPTKISWLTPEEQKYAAQRMKNDDGQGHITKFQKAHVLDAFKDWKIYLTFIAQTGTMISVASFSFFLPSIIKGLGFFDVTAQLLTIPPYVCGLITTVLIAIYSDRKCLRSPFIIFGTILAAFGYILLIFLDSIPGKYVAACLVISGSFPSIATTATFVSNNFAPHVKRAVCIGIMAAGSNLGGIIGGQIYRKADEPRYLVGHTIAASSLGISLISTVLLLFYFMHINKIKRENPEKILQMLSEEEIKNLGDRHPGFIYTY
ncbi:hypothetical protein G9A89_018287 [Geosiphon pyriformis]|nr:hypothetical protein G9A89_018287 [Geosiphon pyriformis]